jgi:LacI family transcriptional regulator
VALLVLDIGNPFFTDVARGAERRASQLNLTVLFGTSDDDASRERSYIDTFDEQRVFGLLVSPVSDDVSRMLTLQSHGTPVVLVDRDATGTPFSSVAVDDVAGGRLAAEHLCATGRRRLAFVGGPFTLRQVKDRLRGAQEAVAQCAGASLEVITTAELSVLAGRSVGQQLRARRPEERPDAVFCANDLLAIGVLQALTLMGDLAVPQDIALIGYDDIDFARSAVIPLSSIRQPSTQIGTAAIDLLAAAAEVDHKPQHIVYQPELIVRASTSTR